MKPPATRNKSVKRADVCPNERANEAVADGKPVQTAQTPPVAAKPQTRKALPVEAPSAHAARHHKDHVKQEKVVRDTFTMPREDYEQLAVLKQRCLDAGLAVKKSELVRAGLLLLASASTKHLLGAVKALEPVKTGRPPKSK
ncbi:hypothetical protein M3I53_31115 [Paraburkholderia sp. CNPSo 3272]|uniref:hypothetical protein n=1 Tax=Paraburkholderia sp. CNPSo 3272 TaxID=2940931 RepID=UPI0020B76D36|nr:hypothetical protein [Paraburkholderia sp. CNPSo 3272]MCP3727519.1 hypothetical protein [Paraburkholderia sp. CNPSo 3272]